MQCRNEKLIMLAKSRSNPSQQTAPKGLWDRAHDFLAGMCLRGSGLRSLAGKTMALSLSAAMPHFRGSSQRLQNSSGRAHWGHKNVGASLRVSMTQPARRCCLGCQASTLPPADASLGLPSPICLSLGPLTACTCRKGDCCGFGVTPGEATASMSCVFLICHDGPDLLPHCWSLKCMDLFPGCDSKVFQALYRPIHLRYQFLKFSNHFSPFSPFSQTF